MEYGRRFLVTLICMIQSCVSVGLIYGFSVMYADLIVVFSTSRLTGAFIQGTFDFTAYGGGILWTFAIHRLGIGLSVAFGSVIACVGFAASSLASNSQTIIVCTGVISGAGLSIGYMAPFAVVVLMYKVDASFPIALLTVAGSVGQIIMPHIYRILLDDFHWSGVFIILAGIALQGFPCGILIHYSKDVVDRSGENNVTSAIFDRKLCMDRVVWLYLLNIILIVSTANFEMWFLVDQMSSLGYTYVFGTALISVIGFANLVGRLLGSIVKFKTKSFPAVYNMLYTCPVLAVGHSLFILLQTFDKWMYVACAVHGFAFGLMNVFLPVTMYEFVDNENFQQAVSFLNMAYGVGNLLSNYVGGSLRDLYGEYDLTYEVGIVVSILVTLGLIIIACIMRKRERAKLCLIHQHVLLSSQYKSID